MSRYEVALIRAALIWLLVTAILGVIFYLLPSWAAPFRTTHVHFGALGFALSLIMGVAFWLMPRPGGLRQERLEAWTFWLFHPSLVVRGVAEPWVRSGGPEWLVGVEIVAGLGLVAAIAVFVVSMFARVKTIEEIQRRSVRRSSRSPTDGDDGANAAGRP